MINKKDLIRKVSKKVNGLTQNELNIVYDELIDAIFDTLKDGETIYLAGFGKFSVADVKEVTRKCPTGQVVTIPAHKEPRFKFFKTAKVDFA